MWGWPKFGRPEPIAEFSPNRLHASDTALLNALGRFSLGLLGRSMIWAFGQRCTAAVPAHLCRFCCVDALGFRILLMFSQVYDVLGRGGATHLTHLKPIKC